MDPGTYSPGAGTLPPVLAGRDDLLRDLDAALTDVATAGRARAQDVVLAGPRGIGRSRSPSSDERPPQPASRSSTSRPWPDAGLVGSLLQEAASPGTLAEALASLAAEVRRDAPGGGLLITVDELQVASHGDLALLAATLHRLNVDHPEASVVFAGTGLPHLPEVLRTAGVTHPDRLSLVESLPSTLADRDAVYAIVEPARRVGVLWQPEAAARIVRASNGCPAHLQQFAHTVWATAAGPRAITVEDVVRALPRVERDLDRRTLGPRWERMSDRQREYLAAVSLHSGRVATRVLAATLGRTASQLSWIRQDLIDEGDVCSPRRGHLALAVPVFAPFVLAHHEEAREDAETELLPLAVLRERATAAIAPRPLPEVARSRSAE